MKLPTAGRSSSLVFLSQVARAGAQWVLIWLFARAGGPVAVGQLAVCFAITTPAFMLAELGLRNVFLTMRHRPAFSQFIRLRLGAATAAAVLTNLIPLVSSAVEPRVLLPLTLIKFVDSVLDMFLAVPQAQGRIGTYASAGIANAAATIVLASLATVATSRAPVALWASLLGSTVTLIAIATLFRSVDEAPSPEGRRSTRALFTASLPLGLATGVNSALAYLPVLFLAWVGDMSAETGIYAAAAYALTFGNLVLASAQQALLPQQARQVRDTGRSVSEILRRTLLAFGGVSLSMALPCLVLLPWLMPVLYGPEFVIDYLEALPFALCLLCLAGIYSTGTALMLLNAYRRQLTTATGALVISLVVAASLHESAGLFTAGVVALAAFGSRAFFGVVASRSELRRAAAARQPTTRGAQHG